MILEFVEFMCQEKSTERRVFENAKFSKIKKNKISTVKTTITCPSVVY